MIAYPPACPHILGKKGGFVLSTSTARRRAAQLRRNRRPGRNGQPGILRLVICGVIFVLLVAVKLLFPETMSQLADTARRLISQDADFKEAFAAMGRVVSGEQAVSDSLQDAYTAVFNPAPQDPEPEGEEESAPEQRLIANANAVPAEKLPLRYPSLQLPEADRTVMRELLITTGASVGAPSQPAGGGQPATPEPDEEADSVGTEAASYVYTMPAPPENASLELRNLGFDHCTPVSGTLTSTFGWREHPVEGGNKFHYGVDLAAEAGTDVLAFADGVVYATGESSTLGNYLMLRHEGGYITLYAHCSRITATGGSVAMGEKVAEVGATGLVTGPHLHFELHDGDLYLNPIYYVAVG